jgi:hypothetical protein
MTHPLRASTHGMRGGYSTHKTLSVVDPHPKMAHDAFAAFIRVLDADDVKSPAFEKACCVIA